ncbi:Sodium/potassium-transporting ATPase subunit beta [Armadillidium nasatum]|uniref:Sodium/potassium-transporting ATPase subunit beta n=1 Tax=Armadillidium nasatum TaxID=96803 RepID=A0A5N5T0S0_9CRUS|nr:Sodium/potassium-transporting ATPase subunit beta [Armadillidium nasatum]
MLAVFYQTLDTENRPTYTPGAGGSILRNPALGFRPRPREENIESTLIWYKSQDPSDIEHWTKELDEFIKDYEGTQDDGQHIKDCTYASFAEDKENEKKGNARDTRACKFQDTWLKGKCHKGEGWGYSQNSPCVLLKLNRMIDWEPDVYTSVEELPENMPQFLKDHIGNETKLANNVVPPMIWVSCEGENPADKEYLPNIVLTPHYGFPAYYFPYTKTPGYLSPIVGVQIIEPEPNVLINIECRVWAKNIEFSTGERLGMVHFELLRD